MKPVISTFHSPDVEDLTSYSPADPSSFGVLVELSIGSAESVGEDVFDVLVCSPTWLNVFIESGAVLNGRYHLITKEFSWPMVESYLRQFVADCSGPDWETVVRRIDRLAHWEFADSD